MPPPLPNGRKWKKPDTAASAKNREMRGDYFTVFNHMIPVNVGSEVSYMYDGVWDLLVMMFLGMALFHWGFFTNKLRTSTYVMWLLIGYGVGLPIAWSLFSEGWMGFGQFGAYIDRWRVSHQVFAEFRRIPVTIGHEFADAGVPEWCGQLADAGFIQCGGKWHLRISCTFIFYGYGFSYFGHLRFHQILCGVWGVGPDDILFDLAEVFPVGCLSGCGGR